MFTTKGIIDQSSAFLMSIFEDNPNGIAILDKEGKFLAVNPMMCELFGYNEKEFVEFGISDVSITEKMSSIKPLISRLANEKNNKVKFHKIYRHKSGKAFHAETLVKGIFDEANGLSYFIATISDITKEKNAEISLVKSERRFRTLFEDCPLGIVLLDIQTRKIVHINHKFKEILGYPESEIIGKPTAELTFFEDVLEKKDLTGQLLEGAIPSFSTTKQYLNKNNQPVWCKVTRSILEVNEVQYLIGFVEDLSKQKAAEEESRKSHFLNRNITEIIPDYVGIVNFDTNKLVYNNYGNNYFGVSLDGIQDIRQFFAERIHPDDYESGITEFRERLKNASDNEIIDSLFRIKDSEGNERWVHERARVYSRKPDGSMEMALFIHMEITREKQAEQALIESEAIYRGLFEQNDMGICRLDQYNQIARINPAFSKMLGYAEEELLQRPITDFFTNLKREDYIKIIGDFENNEINRIQLESELTRSDGTILTGLATARRLEDANGNFKGILASIVDISELKRTQEELEVRNRFIEKVNETVPDILYIYDLVNEQIVYSNQKLSAYLGYPQNESVSILELMHPDDKATVADQRQLLEQSQDKKLIEIEYRLKHNDGTYRWFNCRQKVYQRDNKGKVTQYIALSQDITSKRVSELALHESESKFKDIVENLSEFITISDFEGHIEYASPAIKKILGHEPESLIGQNFRAFIVADESEEFLNALEDNWPQLRKGHPVSWEVQLKCKEGDPKWVGATTVWFRKPTTQEVRFISICRDITVRKKMDNAVAKVYQSVPGDQYHDFFNDMVRSIAEVLQVPYVFFGTPDFSANSIRCESAYIKGELLDDFEYELSNSPCERVILGNQKVLIQENLKVRFPLDTDLQKMEVKSFLGIPLLNASNEAIGILNIMDVKKFADPNLADNILQIFASRLAGELQRHAFQLSLSEREAQFRGLYENNPIPVAVSEVNGKILRVNPAYCRMLGYTENEITGRYASEFSHPDDVLISSKAIHSKLGNASGAVHNYQKRYLHKDGHTVWVDITVSLVQDDQSNYEYLIGVVRDISESKKVEEERLGLYHEQQEMLDAIPALFFFKDDKNNIIRCNKAAAASINKTVEELEGKNTVDIYPDFADEYLKDDLEVIHSGKPKVGIVEPYMTPEGTRWLQTDKTPYFSRDGKATGVLVYATDITDLKRAHLELEEKNEKLEQYINSNMLLENFAYIASHDLKEPVRTVCNFAQLLGKKYENQFDERGTEFLNFIISGALEMDLLINDLLTYSRVRSQKKAAVEVDLDKLMFLLQRNLDKSIKENNVNISFENMPDRVNGNKTKLAQLFQNLVSNAIKYRKPAVAPVIKVYASDSGDHWKFSVEDNGIGIEACYFDRIFLLFKKLHSKYDYEGTGIGLALCKKIVEQHQGKIWVESTLGVGTTFSFTISKDQRAEV